MFRRLLDRLEYGEIDSLRNWLRELGRKSMVDGRYHITNPEGREFQENIEDDITDTGFHVNDLMELGYKFVLIQENPKENDDD